MHITKGKKKIISAILATTIIGNIIMPKGNVKAADDNISTNLYGIKENYILNIAENTTVGKLLENVQAKNSEEIKIYKNGNVANAEETIQTGMELTVGNTTYLLVINGDVNGDGKIATVDIAMARMTLTKQHTLEGAYFQAADVNHDGTISSVDVAQIRMHRIGVININKSPEDGGTGIPKEEILKNLVPTITKKINNKIIITDVQEENYTYYYSKDNGTTWGPDGGATDNIYEFNNIEPNSVAQIKVKRVEKNGNAGISEAIDIRTFKAGTDFIKENIANVEIEGNTVVWENGEKYAINNTEYGGYSIIYAEENKEEHTENTNIEADIEIFHEIVNLGVDANIENAEIELLNKMVEESIIAQDKVNTTSKTFITPNGNVYMVSISSVNTEENNGQENAKNFIYEYLGTEEEYNNNVLTNQKLEQIEELKSSLTTDEKAIELLNKIIEEGILEAENVNTENITILLPNGNRYKIKEIDGEIIVEQITIPEGTNEEHIQEIENAVKKGVANQLIDWAIADGITTEENANREEGTYTTEEGKNYKITVDLWFGNYSIEEYENNVEINENAEGEEYVENEA